MFKGPLYSDVLVILRLVRFLHLSTSFLHLPTLYTLLDVLIVQSELRPRPQTFVPAEVSEPPVDHRDSHNVLLWQMV